MKQDNNLVSDQANARTALIVIGLIVASVLAVIFYNIGYYNGRGGDKKASNQVVLDPSENVDNGQQKNEEVLPSQCPEVPTPDPDFCPGGSLEAVMTGECLSEYKCTGQMEAEVCSPEGTSLKWAEAANVKCCAGLVSVFDCQSAQDCAGASDIICVNCGNGECGNGENDFNCPVDCPGEN